MSLPTRVRDPEPRAERPASRPVEAVADAVGRGFGVVARLRHARAVHPAGVTARAVVTLDGDPRWPSLSHALAPLPAGVLDDDAVDDDPVDDVLGDALDDDPVDVGGPRAQDGPGATGRRHGDAVVRLSRGVGLPPGWPDVLGLALSVDHGLHGRFDVLLGAVRGSRVLLTPGRTWTARTYTTVLPYVVDGAPVWLAAVAPRTPRLLATPGDDAVVGLTFDLAAASLRSGRRRLGTLTITEVVDDRVAFDPIVRDRPGVTPWPGWLSAVRRRAYARSRQGRGL